jgi:hypothetical protein
MFEGIPKDAEADAKKEAAASLYSLAATTKLWQTIQASYRSQPG